jgi:subtilisin family serine protease
VAVLDSGLDTEPMNPDLPSIIEKKDYSAYPTLDDNVENLVTSHGTHVTGSVLGRGVLSSSNIGNGGSSYKGVAPSAGLVFLKIGNDFSGGASTNAIVNAMDAAVNIYNADIISMSYGGWDTYHDGTSAKDQKVDWCYSQGVPVFLAAGNDGSAARHFSGIVESNSFTDFIQIKVTGAAADSTYLYFNLVWFDGLGINNNLFLKYYDNSFQEITNTYAWGQTESTRGTESVYSYALSKVPAGNRVYYLKVENASTTSQSFHIYESYNDGQVSFANPDPNYTIVSPATATYGFCAGAFTSRAEWIAYNGSNYSFGEIQNEIMSFSSRGPRIDGVQKPDIVAPGSAIISIRDKDVLTVPDLYWIDNDGNTTGEADYYVMQGTSMAAPQCAGAAALFLNKFPEATPLDLYKALRNYTGIDEYTGTVPNSTFGYGKLDIYAAVNEIDPLPVELTSFSAIIKDKSVTLNWRTETEVNNYGFEIQRSVQTDEWEVLGFVEGHGNSNSPKEYNFSDSEVNSSGTVSYRLKQIDNDGTYEFSMALEVNIGSLMNFELNQNYPNPFNPSTTINYQVPKMSFIKLKVYDVLGNEILTLINEEKSVGSFEVDFNAINLPSGVYFYKLQAGSFVETKKMVLMK